MAHLPVLPERIETGRLVIRQWMKSDIDEFAAAIAESIEHLRPWMEWAAHEPDTTPNRLERFARWHTDRLDGGDGVYAFFAGDTAVGSGGLHRRAGPEALEIGYWIRAAHVRQGYATEASRGMTTAAFADPGIERVEIHHDAANIASRGVPAGLGFTFVDAYERKPAAPADDGIGHRWQMLRSDWPEHESPG